MHVRCHWVWLAEKRHSPELIPEFYCEQWERARIAKMPYLRVRN